MTKDYYHLIKEFLDKKITPTLFQEQYSEHFLSEDWSYDVQAFHILDELWADTDLYTSDLVLLEKDPDKYVNEEALRASAATALKQLQFVLKDMG